MAALSVQQIQQIASHLQSRSLYPTQAWLSDFASSQKQSTPLPAIKQTALFRLMASDITVSLDRSASLLFPSDLLDANIKERSLTGPLPVQLLDIEDVGTSKASQLEALESAERGETTKGREIVRVAPGEVGGPDSQTAPKSKGPHKLLLQDAQGMRVYGFEIKAIDGLNMNMSIGSKLVLQNATVARGVVLLDTKNTILLGGKIDALHKAWKDGLKASFQTALAAQTPR